MSALDAVLAVGAGFLAADLACEGLAACDVVARLRGKAVQAGQQDAYTELLDAWVQAQTRRPPPELVSKALAVVVRSAGEASELALLWGESDEHREWRARVAALRARLAT